MPFLTDPNPPEYGSYTFPTSVETTGFECDPVMDEANRTVLYVRHRVTLQWKVVADLGNNIDSAMASIRTVLMQRGQPFVYQNRGFGADWSINDGGTFTDVNGGPVPTNFSFKPLGGNRAAQCSWTVEVCVPSNCAAFSIYGVLMTFNYKLRIGINEHGYSSRTYMGHIAIPKVYDDHDIVVSDQFLDDVIPAVPEMFKRLARDYDHSFDKKRTDFTVVDEQMGSRALPVGCTAATASHELFSEKSGFASWYGTITANYVLSPSYKPEAAWAAFYELVAHRMQVAKLAFIGGSADEVIEQQKPKQDSQSFILSLRMSEPEIYGMNTVGFEVTYVQVCSLEEVLKDGFLKAGLWHYPYEGPAAWQLWVSSVPEVLRPRGLANLQLDPANEIIVDLCLNSLVPPPQQDADFTGGDLGIELGDITDLQPSPDVDASWFYYNPEIEIYEDSHAIVTSSLIEEPYNPYEQSPGDLYAEGYVPDEKPAELTDQVQYRAPSTLIIYIAGEAMRAWFPIPRPKIVSWNGLQVKEVSTIADGCFFRTKTMANLGVGTPIYYAEWRFKYVVELRPVAPIRPPVSRHGQV
ncbi:MAG: hypothetical protein JNJ77_20055 [Planctomycetia bacterium]|nr:hypothetical protein [Planctomycetia bacterium]